MLVDNIRKLCKERKISVTELEKAVGIGNGLVGKWSENSPRVDRLKAVADYFGVTIDELLKEDTE